MRTLTKRDVKFLLRRTLCLRLIDSNWNLQEDVMLVEKRLSIRLLLAVKVNVLGLYLLLMKVRIPAAVFLLMQFLLFLFLLLAVFKGL